MTAAEPQTDITPDSWALLRNMSTNSTHILAGWSGGYLDGDSWRLSTSVTNFDTTTMPVVATTKSGSTYIIDGLMVLTAKMSDVYEMLEEQQPGVWKIVIGPPHADKP